MGEAIAPEGDRSRAASTPRQQGRPLRPADHDIDITTRPTKRDSDIELTPEDSLEIKKGKEDKRAAIGLPHQGNGEPSEREMRHVNENALHISGLSGVSDIIAEVIAEGDVDANEFGITEQQKLAAQQKILDRKEEKLWEYTRLSNDELRNIFHLPKQVDDTDPGFASVKPIRRSIEDREELQSWMSKRKEKQMAEYKQALLERRQAEREPYQPPKEDIFKPSSSLREIKKNEGSRRTVKRTTKDDDIQERVKDAYKLMGEILADKPDLPKEPIISTSRTHKSAVSTTTGKKDMGRGDPEKVTKARNLLYKEAVRVAGENKVRQPRRFDEHDRTLVRPDDYLHLRDSFEKDREYGQIPKSTYRIDESRQVRSYLPERSRDPVHRSFDSESTGITSAYARQLERQLSLDVDKSATLERIPESSENKENEPMKDKLIEEEYYEYKPKSYTQIVKIQRPHITRKQSQRTVKTYSERLADMKASSSRKHDSDSLRAKQRLYGTKRIPGSAKTVAAGPRVVKTYTERLADMRKQGEAQTRLLRPQRRPAKRPSVNTACSSLQDKASEMSGLSFSEMDYIDGDEYTSMVDIHELEDIASVGSGSIISDIDWSVIEKMVADVK
uniref:Uncharacterized protein LOC102808262 n=1 Tax=Saccoglossus kowalevskii TaxID=10224 RepID=A0ABM0M807_SACKO|nr:PREDICTED: uncharacterized protein LOC102808262 [Saccoglossus kowalevskii]